MSPTSMPINENKSPAKETKKRSYDSAFAESSTTIMEKQSSAKKSKIQDTSSKKRKIEEKVSISQSVLNKNL